MTQSTRKAKADGFTTFCLRQSTKRRLDSLKPFESMSYDEFAQHLADIYEEHED